jgi:hypothetical protein
MRADVATYLAKVPPLHAGDPNMMAELALLLQPLVDIQNLLADLPTVYFDLDYAIGVQLDILGKWIGRTRDIPVPLQNIFLSLGDPLRGLGKGIWYNPDVSPGVTYSRMDDETYRRLLKAVAAANEWNGTVTSAGVVLDRYFIPAAGSHAFMQDCGWGVQDGPSAQMKILIGVSGVIPNIVDIEVLAQGLLGLKPATVDVGYVVTSINGAPIFGLGVSNDYVGGLGAGAWGVGPSEIAHSDSDLLDGGLTVISKRAVTVPRPATPGAWVAPVERKTVTYPTLLSSRPDLPLTGGWYLVTKDGLTIPIAAAADGTDVLIIGDATGEDSPNITIYGTINGSVGGFTITAPSQSVTLAPVPSLNSWWTQ